MHTMEKLDLIKLREEIDKIDTKILSLFKERFDLSIGVGKYKLIKGLAIEDKRREEEIINSRVSSSKLDEDFVKSLFELIFNESKKIQMEIK
jgi:chorismate mutase/prephenate dehydratase